MSFRFRNSILGCAVKIHLIAHKHLDWRVGFFVYLDPFLHILETLTFGHIEHVDGSCASKRVTESILSVANTTGDFPIVEPVDGFFLGEGDRLDAHLF